MNNNLNTKLLEQVSLPSELRKLSPEQLPAVAEELREFMIKSVEQTGGASRFKLGRCRTHYCASLYI